MCDDGEDVVTKLIAMGLPIGPIPPNEEERVKALRNLRILDSEREADFDRITALCFRLFGAENAGIVLVDSKRHFHKSQFGPFAEVTNFPRTAFCSHTIYQNTTLVVEDTLEHEEYKDHPVIKASGLRFYAGVPLRTPSGFPIGTLCLSSMQPRIFDQNQRRNLEDLAVVAMQAIELRLSNLLQKEKMQRQRELCEELEDDKKMLLMGLNTFPEGIFLWNSQLQSIIFVNEAFEKITGYSSEEIQRKKGDPTPFFVEEGEGTVRDTLKDMFSSPRDCAIEFEAKNKCGNKRWMSIHMAPTDPSNNVHCFGVLSDVTLRKENELELRKTQAAAQLATDAKNSFLANMSHEIRTPLNAICASSELILESKQSGEQKELTHMINSSAHTLLALVNDILDFSKIEANVVDLVPTKFELRSTVENCIDMLYIRAAHKSLVLNYEIHSDVPSVLYLDEPRLRQILTNLLNNAITFTPRGEVELTVSLKRSGEDSKESNGNSSKDEIEFSVRDTGIGIKESSLNRLFQCFSQVDDSRTRKYGGTGLGLAISQKLVRAMGGQMKVNSVYGSGSTFSFTIPSPNMSTAIKRHSSFSSIESKQILLVAMDSNERMISSLLKSLRTHVKSVSSVEEAKKVSASFAFDALVLGPSVQWKGKEDPIEGTPTIHLIRRSEVEDHASFFTENRNILTYPLHQASFKRMLEELLATSQNIPANKMRKHSNDSNAPMNSLSSPDHKSQSATDLSILIAEDNKFNQRVLIKILESLGYKPQVVENGIEVLDALKVKKFDLILMDLQMPEMDGLEATKIIQTHKEKPSIIAITADVLTGIEDKCREAGMQGYIAKPVKKQQIAEALEKISSPVGEREDWIVFH
eukprot:TRINITY_DN5643_c0_g1_i1.p1 TRINITY_DN5643_c0_g1~~TRINITY_DN5643_c0_g1_i1.p1  ORF type:complete len:864 (-),score=308.38 TRINITY_DN5643_c0_g1_i1:302-2893(-)